jgi:uncharacterized protein (TIGR03083 family)
MPELHEVSRALPTMSGSMPAEEAWRAVAEERAELSTLLLDTDPEAWEQPSPCGDWSVKDVVAHLVVLAEAGNRYVFIARSALIDPRFHKSIDKVARQLSAAAQPHELAARLGKARDGRFLLPFFPPVAALGEVLVHRLDVSDAFGLPAHAPDERVRAVLETQSKLWFVFGVSRSIRKYRFVATDSDWSVGPVDGAIIEAPGEQLLQIATGRRQPSSSRRLRP